MKYEVCSKNIWFYFLPTKTNWKLILHGQNPFSWEMKPTFLCMHKNFHTCRLCQFLAVIPRVQMCTLHLLNFCFHQTSNILSRCIVSGFAPNLVILMLKSSRSLSKPLAMMPWARLRSRSGTTTSIMATPQWRVRHAQASQPQAEMRSQLRRFTQLSWKTVM